MRMSSKKKVRERFRYDVYAAARISVRGVTRIRCQGPGCSVTVDHERAKELLDCHHITDRNLLPAGGYVATNGIALCDYCHRRAEKFHETGVAEAGWSPADLYRVIGSSLEQATRDSRRLEAAESRS
jgi:hypothetical protein